MHSGSGYVARLLTLGNKDVGHEIIKNDGISSWQIVACLLSRSVKVPVPYNDSLPVNSTATTYIHFVRDPNKCLASIRDDTYLNVWQFVSDIVKVDLTTMNPSLRAAIYYIVWNELVESTGPTHRWRVEDNPEELLASINVKPTKKIVIPTNINTRGNHEPFDFELLPDNVFQYLAAMSSRYGYSAIIRSSIQV